jgi:hypothetical protein
LTPLLYAGSYLVSLIREAAANHYLDHFLTQVEFAVRSFGRTTFEIPGRAEEAMANTDASSKR